MAGKLRVLVTAALNVCDAGERDELIGCSVVQVYDPDGRPRP